MATGVASLIVVCLAVDWLSRRVAIPGLIGMLVIGVAAGPFVLDLLDPGLMAISADLRLIALVIILLRAGLELSLRTLRKVGDLVLLLSVVPAVFEIAAVTLAGPWLLGLTTLEAAILALM